MVKSNCPICASERLATLLHRPQVPVHQNLVMASQRAATEIECGELAIVYCEDCSFVFNRSFDLSKLSYGEHYDNTQTYSPRFQAHIDQLLTHLLVDQVVQHCRIVEVGCGRGQFLRSLIEPEAYGNTGHGFDPSYIGPLVACDGRLHFHTDYYGSDAESVPADVIVCRHVIEHIPDPLRMLRSIRRALEASPNARVYFETPCVEWILRNRTIQDFFYEHCSYFSTESLRLAFQTCGFHVDNVLHVFGGQYLWLEARLAAEVETPIRSAGAVTALAREFSLDAERVQALSEQRMERLARKGAVAIWGAGAKGATFAHLLDPERQWISCIIDLNPEKQGKYLPKTGHPIVGYEEISTRSIRSIILMNPNYRAEVEQLLFDAGLIVELLESGTPGENE